MNRQSVFNTAAWRMLRQGHKAFGVDSCVYFDEETGYRCAVGHLISERLAKEIADDGYFKTVRRSVQPEIEALFGPIDENDAEFISRLQAAHDQSSEDKFLEQFAGAMKYLAELYDLDASIVENYPL